MAVDFLYALDQHGRGVGLENHIRVYMQEQTKGYDTVDAHKSLNLPVDARNYDGIHKILLHFGIKRIKLLTNNPIRLEYFQNNGITVERVALEAPLNKYN